MFDIDEVQNKVYYYYIINDYFSEEIGQYK